MCDPSGGPPGARSGYPLPVGIPSWLRIRGLAQSAGAGGSLIAAAVCCLIAVSALLAFRGWPGAADRGPDGRLALRAPHAKAAGRAPSGPVAASTAAPAVRR